MERTNVTDKGYTFNNQNFANETRTDSQGNNYTVAIPTAISSSSLTPVQQVQLPQQPVDNTNYNSIVSGITSTLPDLNNQVTDAENQKLRTNNQLLQEIIGQGNIPTEQATLEQNAGINQKQQDVLNLQNELRNLGTQSQTNILAEQNKATGQNITASAVQRNISDVNRDVAIQTLTKSAQLQAAQGNLSLAQDQVNRAVDLKYKGAENRIAVLKQQYEMNKDALERVDKKRADALALSINKQEKDLAEKRANEKSVGDTLLKVGAYRDINGSPAPQSVLDSIKNAKDPMTATLLAVPYMTDPLERKKKLAEIAKINAEASSKGVSSSTLSKNMPNDSLIAAINNGTIDPNKVNSRTIGIYNTLANASVDAVSSSAGSQARTGAVKKIADQIAQTRRVVTVLDKNMPLLYTLADNVNVTGTPALDKIIAGTQRYTGNNPDVIKYVNTIKTVRAEYAQMLARGGEVTEGTRQEAADAIPTGLSGDGYKALGSQLQLEAQNIIDAGTETYQATIKGNIPTTHQGYILPSKTTGTGSYKGFILPH